MCRNAGIILLGIICLGGREMRKTMQEVKEIYLEIKGTEYKHLTEQEKMFLEELQYQACIMRDFCHALSRSEIIMLIETCKTGVQLEIALRNKKVA